MEKEREPGTNQRSISGGHCDGICPRALVNHSICADMRSWNSPAPTGNENETTFVQGVARKLKSELQFYDSTTVRVEQTTRGVRFHARPARGASSTVPASVGNFNLRGLWSPTPSSPYMTFDAVLLQGGTSGGMYWSTMDNNSNSPDSGVGWTQLSTVLGSWL